MQPVKRFPLGRFESPADGRDWQIKNFSDVEKIEMEVPKTVMHWPFQGKTLYQGDTGHCCGFGDAHYLINEPVYTPCTDEDGHRFYYMCKEFDGEPGNEEGSNIRSAAKVLQKLGRIENYAFAGNIDEMIWWILHKGPMVVGTIWTEGMFDPDRDGTIHAIGAPAGGHCYLFNGVDTIQRKFYGPNSWGQDWGDNGFFSISFEDFAWLFHYGGEALSAVEIENRVLPRKLSVIELIINFIISLFKKEK